MNYQSTQLLLDLSANCLLHLYLTVAEEQRIVPQGKRNDLVVKYLKRQVDRSVNKPIRKEIRSLIKTGRSSVNLENTLLELNNAPGNDRKPDLSDAGLVYELFQSLEAKHGFSTEFTDLQPTGPRCLSLSKSQLQMSFDDDGQMIAPFTIVATGITGQALFEMVSQPGLLSVVEGGVVEVGPREQAAIEVTAIRAR